MCYCNVHSLMLMRQPHQQCITIMIALFVEPRIHCIPSTATNSCIKMTLGPVAVAMPQNSLCSIRKISGALRSASKAEEMLASITSCLDLCWIYDDMILYDLQREHPETYDIGNKLPTSPATGIFLILKCYRRRRFGLTLIRFLVRFISDGSPVVLNRSEPFWTSYITDCPHRNINFHVCMSVYLF